MPLWQNETSSKCQMEKKTPSKQDITGINATQTKYQSTKYQLEKISQDKKPSRQNARGNKTSIQWTLDVKFILETIKKNNFCKTKSKKFSGIFLFWEKQNMGKQNFEFFFLGKKLEKICWNSFFQHQVTISSAHPV